METVEQLTDLVNHPPHYNASRFGTECISFTRYMTFAAGNAFKYIWRHADKGNPVQDLEKALVYLEWAREDWREGNVWPVLTEYEQHLRILADKHLGELGGAYAALDCIRVGSYERAILYVNGALDTLR